MVKDSNSTESILRIWDNLCWWLSIDGEQKKENAEMLNRLNEACNAYEMKIKVQKTIVMLMNRAGKPKGMQRCIMLDKVPLEQVTRFKYP